MKYIIDIPDNAGWIEYYSPINEENTRFKGDAVGIDRLEPYTEPDRQAIEDAQEEAWEFAKQVTIMTPDDKCELWGTSKYNTINLGYSYAEAKAKYVEWKKQKDEIHVGDELKDDGNIRAVVLDILDADYESYEVITENGIVDEWQKGIVVKTGRHFDEVEELLKKMKVKS